MPFLDSVKTRAKQLKRDTLAVWYAARDTRTPWYAKALALLITAYAFSPIDLIPDFIPVLGVLDDLILIPAGIALAIKLIPAEVMHDAREKAEVESQKPVNLAAGFVIVVIWLVIIFFIVRGIFRLTLSKG
jgi:uncharacterized membrane protein YkvA (DUF1232 family)